MFVDLLRYLAIRGSRKQLERSRMMKPRRCYVIVRQRLEANMVVAQITSSRLLPRILFGLSTFKF